MIFLGTECSKLCCNDVFFLLFGQWNRSEDIFFNNVITDRDSIRIIFGNFDYLCRLFMNKKNKHFHTSIKLIFTHHWNGKTNIEKLLSISVNSEQYINLNFFNLSNFHLQFRNNFNFL